MFTMETLKAVNTHFKTPFDKGLREMSATKIGENIYLIDVQAGGIRNFIASYVLKGKQVAIIETGPTSSVQNLLSGLKELNVKLEDVAYVAVSHIHLDHGGGVGTLLRFLPKAKVIVHPRGAPHLANPEKLWQQSREVLKGIAEMYGAPEPVPEERIIASVDGMTFDIGNNVELRVVETLGHASHHQSYYEPLTESLFPGDAAGIYLSEIDAIVPTTPSPFRLDIALASLDKLISLKPKALYYTHYGKTSNPLEKLQTYSRQLNLWAKVVKQGLEEKEDLKMIIERIIRSDEALQRALEHIRVHPVLSETVFNESLRGFIDFVEKFGWNPQ
jgi:glyoxylase-like metal-dependent hydrolase (beta-lactamase superfamily II)